jgi:hypothetical protein
MKTKIFEYKGFVGAESNYNAEGLLNNPEDPKQLGFVLDGRYVDISPKAFEIIKTFGNSYDDIGVLDVFKSDNGTTIVSMLGGPKFLFGKEGQENVGSNSSDFSLLENRIKGDVEAPEDFKEFIDVNEEKLQAQIEE